MQWWPKLFDMSEAFSVAPSWFGFSLHIFIAYHSALGFSLNHLHALWHSLMQEEGWTQGFSSRISLMVARVEGGSYKDPQI